MDGMSRERTSHRGIADDSMLGENVGTVLVGLGISPHQSCRTLAVALSFFCEERNFW